MAAQVEVRERGLGLLRPRLNAGPVGDNSLAEGSICTNVALCKCIYARCTIIMMLQPVPVCPTAT